MPDDHDGAHHPATPPGRHVGDQHDWRDPEYVERWIEEDATADDRRRPQLREAAAALPLPHDRAVSVLDLGAGYGEFSAAILAEFPRATVCLQDVSAPMLDHARTRLAHDAHRIRFCESDLRDPAWVEAVGGPFDAVVSALTIHNLGEAGAIPAVYEHVAEVLRPGGWFFSLDLVLDVALSAPSAPLAVLYRRLSGGVEDEHRAHDHHDEHDAVAPLRAATLSEHLDWLRRAGFEQVDCPRKDLSEVFLVGRRAG